MKKLVVFLALGFLLLAGCAQQPPAGNGGENEPPVNDASYGKLVLSITGGPASENEYEAMNVVISGVEVQKQSGEWLGFSSGEKELDLFSLSATKEKVGEKELEEGAYAGVRFKVKSLELLEKEDSGETEKYVVMVPVEKVTILKDFRISGKAIYERVIDFDPYSVVLENGEYIFRPVTNFDVSYCSTPDYVQSCYRQSDPLAELQ